MQGGIKNLPRDTQKASLKLATQGSAVLTHAGALDLNPKSMKFPAKGEAALWGTEEAKERKRGTY